MEGALTILVFMGVIAVTALVFGVWLFITIVRGLFRGLGLMFNTTKPSLPAMPAAMRTRVCEHERCLAVNPATARFCRRCGRELAGGTHVNVRRAAIW
jgi:ribosomal protein L40E